MSDGTVTSTQDAAFVMRRELDDFEQSVEQRCARQVAFRMTVNHILEQLEAGTQPTFEELNEACDLEYDLTSGCECIGSAITALGLDDEFEAWQEAQAAEERHSKQEVNP